MSRQVYGAQRTAMELKIKELKEACNAAITGGVDVETDQGVEHFSLTTDDQINIQNLTLQIAAGASGVLYHADGKLCRQFTAEELSKLTTAAVGHVTYHTTLFNHLKAWAERTKDNGKLAAIAYNSKLPKDLALSMAELLGGTGNE